MFADDGSVPNNARLPFVVYRHVIDLIGTPDPEPVIEKLFRGNGWGDIWRNGIFPYVHYHSMIHEGMGIARGRAKVRFGGNKGQEIDLVAGRRLRAAGRHRTSMPVGEPRSDGDRQPIRRPANTTSAAAARASTPRRCKPSRRFRCRDSDPVFGKQGPLLRLWQSLEAAAPDAARPTGSNSGTPSIRSTSTPGTRPRTSAASPRTSAPMRRERGVMLDYGCGEALSADRVAEPVSRLILCEPAPNVRVMLGARFAGNDKIAVRKPEDIATMPAGSMDVIVMHSVAQYLGAARIRRRSPKLFRRLLKPGGLLVVGDVIPRKISALADAQTLLRFGWQEGFFWAARAGPVPHLFLGLLAASQIGSGCRGTMPTEIDGQAGKRRVFGRTGPLKHRPQ